LGLPALDQLPPTHTLGDAISLLIACAAAGEEIGIVGGPQSLPKRVLSITFFGPQPAAEIYGRVLLDWNVGSPGNFDSSSQPAFFRYSSTQDELSGFPDFQVERLGLEQRSDHLGDLGQARSVTSRTIQSLGKLLSTGQEGR
jgi:hypothetical protein